MPYSDRMNRVGKGLAGLAAVTALTGCIPFAQASTTDQSSPERVFNSYTAALNGGDWVKACTYVQDAATFRDRAGRSCTDHMEHSYDNLVGKMGAMTVDWAGATRTDETVTVPAELIRLPGGERAFGVRLGAGDGGWSVVSPA